MDASSGWVLLFLAIALEVSGTTCLKLAAGFTRWIPSVLVIFFYTLSFTALGLALKWMDVSLAYAVWAGLGTAAVALIGFVWFQEPISALKLISLLLIIAGVVGLHGADLNRPRAAEPAAKQ